MQTNQTISVCIYVYGKTKSVFRINLLCSDFSCKLLLQNLSLVEVHSRTNALKFIGLIVYSGKVIFRIDALISKRHFTVLDATCVTVECLKVSFNVRITEEGRSFAYDQSNHGEGMGL